MPWVAEQQPKGQWVPEAPPQVPVEGPVTEARPPLAPGVTDNPFSFSARNPSVGQSLELNPEDVDGVGGRLAAALQGLGAGVAETAALPADIVAAPYNALSYLANEAGLETPYVGNLSEPIKEGAGSLAENLGFDVRQPDEMPFLDRSAYEAARFATPGGLIGKALSGLSKARTATAGPRLGRMPMRGDNVLAPYEVNPTAAITQDVSAGIGSGLAVAATNEVTDNPLAEFAASMAGGPAGVTAQRILESPAAIPRAIQGSRVAKDLPYLEDAQGQPFAVRNSTADKAAQWYQSRLENPQQYADDLTQGVSDIEAAGLPMPTPAGIGNDLGAIVLENMGRSANSLPYMKSDKGLKTAAASAVKEVQKPGRPEAATEYADRFGAATRETAQRAVDKAEGGSTAISMAREDRGAGLRTFADQKTAGDASTRVFEIFKENLSAQRGQKNDMFNDPAIAQEPVSVDGLRAAAEAVAASQTPASGAAALPQTLVDDILQYQPGQSIPYSEMQQLRGRLATEYAAARAENNGLKLSNLDKIRDAYAASAAEIANRGTPGGDAARKAVENYKTYAGKYVEGIGGDLKDEMMRGTTMTPSKEGFRFLTSEETAKQFKSIMADSADPQAGMAEARKMLLNQAAAAVDPSGKINPAGIRAWRDNNSAVLGELGLKKEADAMVRDAVNGRAKAGSMLSEVRTARTALKATDRELREAGIGLLIGSSPENAIKSVLASKNPKQTMSEITRRLGNSPEARDGWKRAVADHLVDQVTTTRQAAPGGEDAVSYASLSKMIEKNRGVLEQVFDAEEMNALSRARKIVEPLLKQEFRATTGSPTAERNEQAWRTLEAGLKAYFGVLKGGGILRTAKIWADTLPDDTNAVQLLIAKATLDPKVAKHLATRKVNTVNTPAWNKQLTLLLSTGEGARSFNERMVEPETESRK